MNFEAVSDPLEAMDDFRRRAEGEGLALPESMSLATVSPEGRPHVRVVLLKGREGRCLRFFTNYRSQKARDLEAVPFAEVCVHYPSLALQVRVAGAVEKLSASASDEYFATRPRESQIGAWASPQSEALSSREELDQEVIRQTERFADGEVPRPEHWGGYQLVAERVELWVGQAGRLHDRAEYCFEDGKWSCTRLAP